jgi:membrane-associated phospholipid phosphatase
MADGASAPLTNSSSSGSFVALTTPEDAPLPDAPAPHLDLEPSSAAPAVSEVPAAPGNAVELPLQDQPHPPVALRDVPKHFFFDQVHIFTAPAYIRTGDLKWLLPLAGATATALATDHHTMSQVVSRNPDFNNTNGTVSDGLRDSFIALPVIFGGVGQLQHNDHMREAGVLGGQAMLDAYVFDEIVKLSSWRERPGIDNGRGDFFVGRAGTNSSFISGHSVIAWSSAAVFAAEYPSPWHEAMAYSLATGVSLTRVLAQQHFPTDVLLGSAAGWLIGHYVFRAHHHAHIGKEVALR